jgi:cytidylate kinase
MTAPPVIAIDGPVGAGKSTLARALSARLGLERLESGAMYRAVALLALRRGLDPGDGQAVAALARAMHLEVDDRVVLDGEDVTAALRDGGVSEASSVVARHPEVRAELVRRQRAWIAARHGAVVEGRDIGTVVAPEATLKVFLTASLDERARRRAQEARSRSADAGREEPDVAAMAESLAYRDRADFTRETSPLSAARDAVVLDTTGRSVDEVVAEVTELLAERQGRAGQRRAPSGNGPPGVLAGGAGGHPPRHRDGQPGESLPGPMPATRRVRLFYAAARLIMLGLFRALWRVEIEGAGQVPASGAYILAPVHRNNIDTVLAGLVVARRPYYLAKDSLWRYRPAGWLWSVLGGFPVRRNTLAEREALRRCVKLLQSGEPLVIFPEGTRRSGPELGPLEKGAAYLSLRTGAPVVPVGIGGSERAIPRGSLRPRRARISLLVGAPLAPERTGPRIPRAEVDRLTERLAHALQELFSQAEARASSRLPKSRARRWP